MQSLPYLAPASQGQQATYYNYPVAPQPVSYQAPTQLTPDQIQENAIRQARQQSMIDSGVRLSNIQRASFDNGNPMLMRGESIVTMGNGQTLRIPNALAQQLEATAANNPGRWGLGEYFGEANYQKAQRSPELQYSSWGSAQGQLDDWMQKNPAFSGQGLVNPYAQERQDRIDLGNRIQQLSSPQMGVQKERATAGQANNNMSDQSELNRLRQQQQAMGDMSWQAQRKAREGSGDIMNNMPSIRATYSNLPIEERRVRPI